MKSLLPLFAALAFAAGIESNTEEIVSGRSADAAQTLHDDKGRTGLRIGSLQTSSLSTGSLQSSADSAYNIEWLKANRRKVASR